MKFLVFLAVVGAFFSVGCGNQTKVDAKSPDTKIVDAPDVNVVTIPRAEKFPLAAVELHKSSNSFRRMEWLRPM